MQISVTDVDGIYGEKSILAAHKQMITCVICAVECLVVCVMHKCTSSQLQISGTWFPPGAEMNLWVWVDFPFCGNPFLTYFSTSFTRTPVNVFFTFMSTRISLMNDSLSCLVLITLSFMIRRMTQSGFFTSTSCSHVLVNLNSRNWPESLKRNVFCTLLLILLVGATLKHLFTSYNSNSLQLNHSYSKITSLLWQLCYFFCSYSSCKPCVSMLKHSNKSLAFSTMLSLQITFRSPSFTSEFKSSSFKNANQKSNRRRINSNPFSCSVLEILTVIYIFFLKGSMLWNYNQLFGYKHSSKYLHI